jgi:hypothetical protein
MAKEGDDWIIDRDRITSPETLAKIASALEQSILIIEHRHYRGASAPTRLFFEDKEAFIEYLSDHARPGDAFRAWPFNICTDANAVASGKYPDELGRVPLGGAY